MSALLADPWLTDTAAGVTLLIALVLLVRVPCARYFGPGIAYALWLLPMTRAVMPGITLTVEAPVAMTAPALAPTAAAMATTVPPVAAPPIDMPMLLLALWLAGAVLLTGHAMLAYGCLRRAIAADRLDVSKEGRVAIIESDAVDGPVALGIFNPLVVLPRNFAATFTPAEQRQVIAHELEHHRGGDLVINLAAFALLALNWFNPLAWAGWRAFRCDQEAACDARTLGRLGAGAGGDRATYGRAIAVAVAGPMFRKPPAFALAMGGKSALIHRLRSLTMTDITPRRRWLGRTALAAATLLALPLTATISYAVVQTEPPAPPAPPEAPASPGSPAAPLPPLPPEIDMTAGPGEHVRRIERGGRTIILRTDRALSDADVERMVAEAEASIPATERDAASNADATARRDVRRIVIRTHGRTEGTADAAMPVPPVPPVPPLPPVNVNHRTQTAFVFRHDGDARSGDVRTSCDNDPEAERINMASRNGDGEHTQRIIMCGGNEPALRLASLRSARRSLAAMTPEHLPAEARASALAELDQLIAQMERTAGN